MGVKGRRGRLVVTLVTSSVVSLVSGLVFGVHGAAAAATTLYVAQGGTDTANDCTAPANPCATISHAVIEAASGDTIDVAGVIDDHVTVPAGFGSLVITQWPATASGAVDGTKNGTVFTIGTGDTVTLSGLVVEDGQSATDGAGITNSGSLTVTGSTVKDNVEASGTNAFGAIYNVGTLVMSNSTVENNQGAFAGGGIYNGATATIATTVISQNTLPGGGDGGGIFNSGTLDVENSSITGNVAGIGGGIENNSTYLAGPQNNADATVTDTVISGNTGSGHGGGVDNEGGNLTLAESTVTDNTTGSIGGGINNPAGMVTIADSTISANSAPNSSGGGVANSSTLAVTASTITQNTAQSGGGVDSFGPAASASLVDSTIADNSAEHGGGLQNEGGTLFLTDSTVSGNTTSASNGFGGGVANLATLVVTASTITQNLSSVGGGLDNETTGNATLAATILAANSVASGGQGPNCYSIGSLVSAGFNLTDDPTGADCGFTQSSDLVDVDPDLGALQNNGGPTETMAPAPGSPAIARIPRGSIANGVQLCPGVDQRGVSRPQPPNGAACTIGAVEEPGLAAPSITSPPTATFTVGVAGSFQVSATGYPPAQFSETGPLPQGVTFSATGLLSGTPAPGTAGTYPLSIVASNGVSPDATQALTLTVVSGTAVVTGPATAITASSATLNGTVDPEGSAQTCHYSYGTSSDLTGAIATNSFTTPATTSSIAEPVAVSGLAPGTTYYFALECTNGSGAVLEFTTSTKNPYPIQIYGTDGIGTSIAISEQEFPSAGAASCVVLARDDFFSDALAGGPLAASCGGPLLLTEGAPQSATLDPRTQTEIERVLAPGGTVYILGGALALSPSIDGTLSDLGYHVVRLAGNDEYATAVDVAEALGNPSTIFEATGLSFYDALSAVPAAIKEHAAILLTDGPEQSPETAAYLAAHPGDVRDTVGGPLAAGGADPSATNISGPTLFDTSAAVANTFFAGASTFGAATAANFQDALAGGVFMATGGRSGPLLLVAGPPLAPSIVAYLNGLSTGTQGYVFGGPLALPAAVLAALQSAIG